MHIKLHSILISLFCLTISTFTLQAARMPFPPEDLVRQDRIEKGQSLCDSCFSIPPKPNKLQRCGRCKGVSYCSRACQQRAWPSHKKSCNKRRADQEKASLQLALFNAAVSNETEGAVDLNPEREYKKNIVFGLALFPIIMEHLEKATEEAETHEARQIAKVEASDLD